MKAEQAKNDERDSSRAFRWGVAAVIVLVLLALVGYFVLQGSRDRSGVMETPASQVQQPSDAPKAPPQ